ncbi:hypothetical protein EJ08DRAFT_723129 [Tothia fuscella]|uniref:Copper homeostasis protein cutC homolog n=1 Tax=Tothia fuscella TaxID=1048955 RepID=A0A9P4NK74_9PEZI|nr:hypothetical protein EJ08DRAFT_723129 [Tothia fuscella]
MPLEIACFNVESALIAVKAGANRIELCAGASVGGTTPSLEDLEYIKARVDIPVSVMIRPRGGNFVYSIQELQRIEEDIKQFRSLADGFVFGVLDSNGHVDKTVNRRLVDLAAGTPCTFHRAFDEIADLVKGAENVIECGFAAILTSGGEIDAVKGSDGIAEVVKRTKGRLDVITGGGVRSRNIWEIKEKTGGYWFHSSAITDGIDTASFWEVERLVDMLR